ncbi:hypothetical protein Taro_033080 [Colocasia esculenta]|uniref:Uncharacterized protein n=1 Tax=Colocasia esculenta TaxID=4460 RepID=A0A843VWS5_COLES|nr:hypothetical protein [Colocasia esculenta]
MCHNYDEHPGGRIWVLWNGATVQLHYVKVTSQLIHLDCTELPSGRLSHLTVVYGSNLAYERKMLWQDIGSLSTTISLPWLIVGDFNCVRYADEKIGVKKLTSSYLRDFNNCIDQAFLMDLKIVGKTLSWSNHSVGIRRIACRLDRALVNQCWLDSFQDSYVSYGDTLHSDHAQLTIFTEELIAGGPKPFRFFTMWAQHESFHSTVQNAWSLDAQGTPLFVLSQKLRAVKEALKVWNRNVFGRIHRRVHDAASVLHDAQEKLAADPMNNEYTAKENQAQEDYLHSLRMETSYARQRAKQHC